jgi:hypothetical protein
MRKTGSRGRLGTVQKKKIPTPREKPDTGKAKG